MAIRDWPSDERPREKLLEQGRRGAVRRRTAGHPAAHGNPRPFGARSRARCAQEFSLAAQADRRRPAAILRRAAAWARALCRTAGGGRDRETATVGDAARRPFAIQPAGHAGFSLRAAARSRARGILLPVSRQAPPADSIRRTVSRHHRRRERASARDRQTGAAAQFRRRHHRAQSSQRRRGAHRRPTNSSRSGSRRRSRWWTFACSITSSSATARAYRWRNVEFFDT